jgi:hypothetical protein
MSSLAFSQKYILFSIHFGLTDLVDLLRVVLEKGWLETFFLFLPFSFHLVIPSILKHWPPSAMFIEMHCSPYGLLQSVGVIILHIVTIEGG